MRNAATKLPTSSLSAGIDSAIGQIDWIGASGEVLKSWRIRTPKCTLGSASECSVSLNGDGIAPHHLTLVFGKRFTLLRANGPTRIANRLVREWLIDHPTEIQIGPARLVIHPTIGVMATVVHAESLIEQASRLCKEPTPVVPIATGNSIQNTNSTIKAPTAPSLDAIVANEPTSPNPQNVGLANIETLLTSLQESLTRLQSTFGDQAKESEASISKTVSAGIESISKTWFAALNDQFESQNEKQQTLVSQFADQVSDRLGVIDEHLTRFTETHQLHANYLTEILGQAKSEQQVIEARFEEIINHRDELMQAVQILRTEIANAYANPTSSPELNRYEDSASASDTSASQYTYDAQYAAETPLAPSSPELEESLERAQHQIQNYNQQLRALESEKELAQQWVSTIADSLPSETPAPVSQFPAAASFQQADPVATSFQDAEPQAASFQETEPEPLEQNAHVETSEPQAYQLPSWFTQDEPVSDTPATYDPYASQGGYSQESDQDSLYEPIHRIRRSEPQVIENQSTREDSFAEPHEPDSISERLQRMLQEADSRRGSSGSSNTSQSSRRWSQSYGAKTDPQLLPSQATESRVDQQNQYLDSTGSDIDVDPSENDQEFRPTYPQNEETAMEQSESDSSLSKYRSGQYMEQQTYIQDEPAESVAAHPAIDPGSTTAEGSAEEHEEEESIEEYMQRLLQRVRGGSEPAPTTTTPTRVNATRSIPSAAPSRPSKSRVAASLGLDLNPSEAEPEKLEPLTNESFVPRQTAPEQRGELDALRELANSNARRALSRSDHRRTNSAFFFKLGVTALAVTSASALLLLNGLTLNAPFAGMVAAIVVAILWGYDCVNHFKKIKVSTNQAVTALADEKHSNAIQVGSADGSEDRWRPSTT